MRGQLRPALLCFLLTASAVSAGTAQSTCYGSVGNGRLEDGVKLPTAGRNFEPYSSVGASLGRTYVHSQVLATVVDAYRALETSLPGVTFVYGETGWRNGGRIKPHRTHQNGSSVDFMVPVTDAKGRNATLPRDLANRYGYDLEFDAQGRLEDLRIDLAAVGEHLFRLDEAARRNGIGIKQVIFDTQYLPKLFATPRGAWLERNLHFMQREPWIRHDEHYHVDFAVKCEL